MQVVLIPGDGIGPEVTDAAKAVVAAAGVTVNWVVAPGVVESLRVVTRPAAERIVRFAFEVARRESRSRVTFCHKADVLRMSDGLFLDCARQVADEFPFIDFEARRIDN